MNRNTEMHFANIPKVNIKRSIFDLSHSWKTSIDEGYITPIMLKEILPGDTFNVKTNFVLRMTTPIKPVMDNAYIDLYYFFVPNRLVWKDWKKFMGEQTTGTGYGTVTPPTMPVLYGTPTNDRNSLSKAFGIPGGKYIKEGICQLPFRAYCMIYNDFFRNQNVEAPIDWGQGTYDYKDQFAPVNGYYGPIATWRGGELCKAYKFADYFTNALPAPQKGDPVSIGIAGEAPVTIEADNKFLFKGPNTDPDGQDLTVDLYATRGASDLYADIRSTMGPGLTNSLEYKSGLKASADLAQASLININDIRNAFAVQRQLEKDARAGTRYIEIIKENFGVTSSDARLQRPEYLGGGRYPINMQQVLQTSATTSDGNSTSGIKASVTGNTGAFSNTCARDKGFIKSFEEHGYLIGLAVIRTENNYYQGIGKEWWRKERFDYYFPTFANIGEQPILNRELYWQADQNNAELANNTQVYGYQEAWAEYRYGKNQIANEQMDDSQRIWDYTEKITSQPYLSKEYLKEGKGKIDQTLSVGSSTISQFRADFYHEIKATRCMPVYSTPGLIDHN